MRAKASRMCRLRSRDHVMRMACNLHAVAPIATVLKLLEKTLMKQLASIAPLPLPLAVLTTDLLPKKPEGARSQEDGAADGWRRPGSAASFNHSKKAPCIMDGPFAAGAEAHTECQDDSHVPLRLAVLRGSGALTTGTLAALNADIRAEDEDGLIHPAFAGKPCVRMPDAAAERDYRMKQRGSTAPDTVLWKN